MSDNITTYSLPHLLAGQYVLTALRSRAADGVQYTATQKDTQREVLIRSMLSTGADDCEAQHAFIEDARACSRVQLPYVSAVIELLPADGAWHLVFEGNGTDSLDFAAAAGQKINEQAMLNLLQKICTLCLYLDAEGINSGAFHLGGVYRYGSDFMLDNPACSGKRQASTSNRYVIEATRKLLPLLAGQESALRQLMQRVADMPDSCVLVASELLSELARLPMGDDAEELIL